MHRLPSLLLLLALGFLPGLHSFAAEILKPGDKLPELVLGPTTFREVQIRSITVRTVMFTHAGGMASLRLRDLPSAWQSRLGYDPAAEAAAEAAEKARPALPPPAKPKAALRRVQANRSDFDTLLTKFNLPAPMQASVNLRPKYIELGLGVRDQGRSPSCSIYAIVSALEYQTAILTSEAHPYSAEYLTWATCRTTQRPLFRPSESEIQAEDYDYGFSLGEVVLALRTYGIPSREKVTEILPDQSLFWSSEPPETLIREAREHQRVSLNIVPGLDRPARVNNLVLALNAGIPVPIGIAWPNPRTTRSGYLSKQKPMENAYHAVTLVGYECPSGKIEDTVFIFKNSWGPQWGEGGYGRVTHEYLSHYLYDAVLLEVHR